MLLFLLLGMAGAKAQSSLNAAGGNATGTGGSASFSVGQVVYQTSTGAGGSASDGVQQPYEIFTSNEDLKTIRLSVSVFPNPASSVVNLNVEDPEWSKLSFRLFDVEGRQLLDQAVTSPTMPIALQTKAAGTYFLKVRKGETEIKSFKILKNQ